MDLKKLQKIELDMLLFLIRISEKYELNYIPMGGTLLGTIRHNGFIPWDDDVDVGFVRNQYEKFIQIILSELKDTPYELIAEFSNDDYGLAFSKLIDTRYIIEDKSNNNDVINNVFIDIFPYDKVPKCTVLQKVQYRRFQFWNIAILNRTNYIKKDKFLKKIFINIQSQFLRYSNINFMKKKREAALIKYSNYTHFDVTNFSARGFQKEYTHLEDIVSTKEVLFEGNLIKVPKGYDRILTHMYGNYMELPPEHDQVGRHVKS